MYVNDKICGFGPYGLEVVVFGEVGGKGDKIVKEVRSDGLGDKPVLLSVERDRQGDPQRVRSSKEVRRSPNSDSEHFRRLKGLILHSRNFRE